MDHSAPCKEHSSTTGEIDITPELDKVKTQYKSLDLTAKITMIVELNPPGAGGFANVYRGSYNDGPVKSTLAFKCIRESAISREDKPMVLRSLKQEISAWRSLKHPNIQPLCGIYWAEGLQLPVLVSEWRENGNLITYLDTLNRSSQGNAAPRETKLALLRGILDGIEFLHGARIIHADIKGTNILVSSDGTPLLIDFGAAWTDIKRSVSFTAERRDAKGTIPHMAPELLPKDDDAVIPYTQESDMWAFGCLMVEVVTGLSAWKGTPSILIPIELASGKRFPRPGSIDDDSWSLVELCCALEPSNRCTAALLQPRLRSLQ